MVRCAHITTNGLHSAGPLCKALADMNYETTLTYSEPLIRQAVFAFWRRVVGLKFAVAILLTSFGVGFGVAHGDSSWVIGMSGTVLAFGVIFVVAIYFVHYRNSIVKLRDMGSPNATFRTDEHSFTITSGSGTATLQWVAVKELWKTPNAWLMLYSKSHFTTLPVACLSSEMQSFILQRIQAAGGKIVG